jgi:hypothetical protein
VIPAVFLLVDPRSALRARSSRGVRGRGLRLALLRREPTTASLVSSNFKASSVSASSIRSPLVAARPEWASGRRVNATGFSRPNPADRRECQAHSGHSHHSAFHPPHSFTSTNRTTLPGPGAFWGSCNHRTEAKSSIIPTNVLAPSVRGADRRSALSVGDFRLRGTGGAVLAELDPLAAAIARGAEQKLQLLKQAGGGAISPRRREAPRDLAPSRR